MSDTPPLPLVSVVLPCYNEAAILTDNLQEIMAFLHTLTHRFRFEVILVNDGSSDNTGELMEQLTGQYANLQCLHHPTNFGVGQAFKTAFAQSHGDYVVTLDIDLSYAPEHILTLLETIQSTRAKLVLASPYTQGGQLTNVPWLRKTLSVWGNRFLRQFARNNISTLTCMVRAYDGPFLRSMVLRHTGMDIMPEIIYKTMVLRGRIEQIPAHLDWTKQVADGPVKRASSMRIARHVMATIISGYIFRPFMFLVIPGLLMLAFSLYVNTWMVIHFFDALASMPPDLLAEEGPSEALKHAYADHPHTYIIGLLSLMLSLQLIGMGALALQSKKYFEEVFYLGSSIVRRQRNEPL